MIAYLPYKTAFMYMLPTSSAISKLLICRFGALPGNECTRIRSVYEGVLFGDEDKNDMEDEDENDGGRAGEGELAMCD